MFQRVVLGIFPLLGLGSQTNQDGFQTDQVTLLQKRTVQARKVVIRRDDEVVQAAWDNHFSAFATSDVEKILADYSEDSVITVYNNIGGQQQVFQGMQGVQECFEGLFGSLFNKTGLAAPVIEVNERVGDEPGSVFLIWSAAASGYAEATDTFVFDDAGKILRQNVVVTYQDPRVSDVPVVTPTVLAPTGAGPVHSGWANHLGAFGGQNVDQILTDYTETSVITVYNQVDGSTSVFEGLSGVKECFEGLFASLHDTSDLKAPIQLVEEEPAGVFLIWSAAASGYKTATDTFIFDGDGKILRQNVVVHYAEEDGR